MDTFTLKSNVLQGLQRLDFGLARLADTLLPQKPGLVSLVVHSLFEDQRELERAPILPQQGVTVGYLDAVITGMKDAGYRFVGEQEVLDGLAPGGRYAWLTFDDGYANNLRVLPLLRRHGIRATIYISTRHVLERTAFWADVIHRERRRRGIRVAAIAAECAGLKGMDHHGIDAYLTREFGADALRAQHEMERALTADEVRDLARENLVDISNHTHDHAILTNYDEAGVREQLRRCQYELTTLTGRVPRSIAFPNGNTSPSVYALCKEAGFELCALASSRKNHVPLETEPESGLRLAYRDFLEPSWLTPEHQCLLLRSDYSHIAEKGARRAARRLASARRRLDV